jgi:hypothetical protein
MAQNIEVGSIVTPATECCEHSVPHRQRSSKRAASSSLWMPDRTFHSYKQSIMSSCVQAKPLASPMVIACPRIPPNTDPVIDITKYGVGSHSKRMSTIA